MCSTLLNVSLYLSASQVKGLDDDLLLMWQYPQNAGILFVLVQISLEITYLNSIQIS